MVWERGSLSNQVNKRRPLHCQPHCTTNSGDAYWAPHPAWVPHTRLRRQGREQGGCGIGRAIPSEVGQAILDDVSHCQPLIGHLHKEFSKLLSLPIERQDLAERVARNTKGGADERASDLLDFPTAAESTACLSKTLTTHVSNKDACPNPQLAGTLPPSCRHCCGQSHSRKKRDTARDPLCLTMPQPVHKFGPGRCAWATIPNSGITINAPSEAAKLFSNNRRQLADVRASPDQADIQTNLKEPPQSPERNSTTGKQHCHDLRNVQLKHIFTNEQSLQVVPRFHEGPFAWGTGANSDLSTSCW